MSDNTMVLPGDIPGLLRRGSPVWWRDEVTPYTVCYVWRVCGDDPQGGENVLVAPCATPCIGLEDSASNFSLNLSDDPTGRAHAAWWFNSTSDGQNGALVRSIGVPATSLARVMRLAEAGVAMNDADTSILRDACLRLAGRTA